MLEMEEFGEDEQEEQSEDKIDFNKVMEMSESSEEDIIQSAILSKRTTPNTLNSVEEPKSKK